MASCPGPHARPRAGLVTPAEVELDKTSLRERGASCSGQGFASRMRQQIESGYRMRSRAGTRPRNSRRPGRPLSPYLQHLRAHAALGAVNFSRTTGPRVERHIGAPLLVASRCLLSVRSTVILKLCLSVVLAADDLAAGRDLGVLSSGSRSNGKRRRSASCLTKPPAQDTSAMQHAVRSSLRALSRAGAHATLCSGTRTLARPSFAAGRHPRIVCCGRSLTFTSRLGVLSTRQTKPTAWFEAVGLRAPWPMPSNALCTRTYSDGSPRTTAIHCGRNRADSGGTSISADD
jgi:hypothetical protein